MKASLDNLRAKVAKNTATIIENKVQISIRFGQFKDMTLNGNEVFSMESAKMIVRMLKLSNTQLKQESDLGTEEWDNFIKS